MTLPSTDSIIGHPNSWIVCAANRNKLGHIVCGARHFDPIMRSQIRAFGTRKDWFFCEQGFIDQFGNFFNRKEAHIIAKRNGQIRRRCGGDEDELFSENLY